MSIMPSISVEIDNRLLERAQRQLSEKMFFAAVRASAKRAGTLLQQEISEETARDYFISKSDVKKSLELRYGQTTTGIYSLNLFASSKQLSLARYEISPRKRPNTRMHGLYAGVMRKGGMKLIPRGFLLRDNQPWIRESGTEKWKVIKPLRGPSIASIARNPDNLSDVMEKTKETFSKRFQHEVLYRLGVFKK